MTDYSVIGEWVGRLLGIGVLVFLVVRVFGHLTPSKAPTPPAPTTAPGAGPSTPVPPTPSTRNMAQYLVPFIAPVAVMALGWVGYHFAPTEWGLEGYRTQVALGTLGLATALGFILSSLSWKRWGVWGGVVLIAGAIILGVWHWSGATLQDLARKAQDVAGVAGHVLDGARNLYEQLATPSGEVSASQVGSMGKTAETHTDPLVALGEWWGRFTQEPPPPKVEFFLYGIPALWLILFGQWGSKKFDKEMFSIYAIAVVASFIAVQLLVSDPWERILWFFVAMVANKYQPPLGIAYVLGLMFIGNLMFG